LSDNSNTLNSQLINHKGYYDGILITDFIVEFYSCTFDPGQPNLHARQMSVLNVSVNKTRLANQLTLTTFTYYTL